MRETFTTITEWQRKAFPNALPSGALDHIRRELSEVEDAHKFGADEKLREELADVFILWVAACHRYGFSEWEMDAAIDAKMVKNRKRT